MIKTTRVVAALLIRGEEILCCQRASNQPHSLKWEFPGGKIEAGETPEQALVRELQEELKIDVTAGPRVALITHSYTPGKQVELHFFRVDSWTGEPANRVFQEIRWVSRREMPKLDFLEADMELVLRIAAGEVV